MKKHKILYILSVCVIIAGILSFLSPGKKPFKDLEAWEIESATVRLLPPDKTVQIMEPRELVDYLKDVVIYNRDDSFNEYSGQAVIFTIQKTDGTQVEIMEYNPFIVIDGIGYKCKYDPCEALNNYANSLLNGK